MGNKKSINFDMLDNVASDNLLNQDKKLNKKNTEDKTESLIEKNKGEKKYNTDNAILDNAGVPFFKFDKKGKKVNYISLDVHSKLEDVAALTKVGISDIANSILHEFFERKEVKNNIKELLKNSLSDKWS